MLGVVLVVGVVVTLVLVLGGDDDTDPEPAAGPAPAEVVQQVVDAAGDDDCDALDALVTDDVLAADPCASPEWELLASGETSAEVGEAEVDGDSATVPVVFESEEGTSDYTFDLERADDSWRVSGYGEADADGPSEDPTESPSESDGGGQSAGDPAAVVEGYLSGVIEGRCAEADALVTPEFLEQNGTCDIQQDVPEIGDVGYEVGDAEVDGDRAEVTSSLIIEGVELGQVFTLVRRDGAWLIDGVELDPDSLPSAPPSSPGPTG